MLKKNSGHKGHLYTVLPFLLVNLSCFPRGFSHYRCCIRDQAIRGPTSRLRSGEGSAGPREILRVSAKSGAVYSYAPTRAPLRRGEGWSRPEFEATPVGTHEENGGFREEKERAEAEDWGGRRGSEAVSRRPVLSYQHPARSRRPARCPSWGDRRPTRRQRLGPRLRTEPRRATRCPQGGRDAAPRRVG